MTRSADTTETREVTAMPLEEAEVAHSAPEGHSSALGTDRPAAKLQLGQQRDGTSTSSPAQVAGSSSQQRG